MFASVSVAMSWVVSSWYIVAAVVKVGRSCNLIFEKWLIVNISQVSNLYSDYMSANTYTVDKPSQLDHRLHIHMSQYHTLVRSWTNCLLQINIFIIIIIIILQQVSDCIKKGYHCFQGVTTTWQCHQLDASPCFMLLRVTSPFTTTGTIFQQDSETIYINLPII